MNLNERLKHHITGAIERGEATAISAMVTKKWFFGAFESGDCYSFIAGTREKLEVWLEANPRRRATFDFHKMALTFNELDHALEGEGTAELWAEAVQS